MGEEGPRDRLEPGMRFADKYVLLKELGAGGMGSVWLANNELLNARVAIKLVRSRATTSHARERLLQEAQAAASLEHPSIVRVFDFGYTDDDETPFIVMEAVSGESLADAMDVVEQFPAKKAVHLVLHIASALQAAHQQGIVHRDVKPENIILERRRDGRLRPKVVDFGIARVLGTVDRLTDEGMILGSPEYQSPEQATAVDDVDGRADIWALSVVLYEMLVGDRPFDGDTPLATTHRVLQMAPLSFADVGIDEPDLWAIIARGLEKRVGRRWQSMRDFRDALAQWVLAQGGERQPLDALLESDWLSAPDRDPERAAPPKPTTRDWEKLEPSPPRARQPSLATIRMSEPELENAAALDAADDDELVDRVRSDPATSAMTAVAGKGFNIAKAFNMAHARPFPGWKAEMAAPLGPSTGGGKQPLQHISLIAEDGYRFAIGAIDASKQTGTLRSYEIVAALHRQRYHQPFPVAKTDYQLFVAKLETLFRALEMRLVVEVPAALPAQMDDRLPAFWTKRRIVATVVAMLVLIAIAIARAT